jgi:caffeoyl-CoA O-methyltransferase
MATRMRDLVDSDIVNYIAERATPRPDAVLDELRAETAALGSVAEMQVSGDEGALLTILTRITGASNAVELGTFTGYSAICIARGLRPDGRLVCCDVSEKFTSIAQRAWQRAGLSDRIELRLGPALDSLRSMPEDESIDVAFLDADKPNYLNYFVELLPRLRPGGLLMADNTLWSGHVADPVEDNEAENLAAIRRFNDAVAADERVASCILPLRDGLTLITKL